MELECPPFSRERLDLKSYLMGKPIKVTDPLLRKALFLDSHPGWSEQDYDNADQSLLDIMSWIASERAMIHN